MALVKNISNGTLILQDVGFELNINEIFDLEDISSTDISSSLDIPNSIQQGWLVYLSSDGVTELTQAESIVKHKENIQGIDLTGFVKLIDIPPPVDLTGYVQLTEVQNLINLAIDSISMEYIVKDIINMPSFLVSYSDLRFGPKNNSASKYFYSSIGLPYYINNRVITKQTIISVSGKGYLTGIMLPTLNKNDANNRRVKIIITLDGSESNEEFIYSNSNDDKLRMYLGVCINQSNGEHSDSSGQFFNYIEDDDDKNYLISDKRIAKHGLADSEISILHPNHISQNSSFPRMKFNTSMKVEYITNSIDIFSDNNYKNRAMCMYTLGDY